MLSTNSGISQVIFCTRTHTQTPDRLLYSTAVANQCINLSALKTYEITYILKLDVIHCMSISV